MKRYFAGRGTISEVPEWSAEKWMCGRLLRSVYIGGQARSEPAGDGRCGSRAGKS